jgi:hypothetical protein
MSGQLNAFWRLTGRRVSPLSRGLEVFVLVTILRRLTHDHRYIGEFDLPLTDCV